MTPLPKPQSFMENLHLRACVRTKWSARPVNEIEVSLPWVGVGFNGLRAGPNAAFTRQAG